MQSIGYKETQLIEKSEVALQQLNDSLRLFVTERFISSLTLAGAAEEIFARLVESRGNKPATEISIELLKSFGKTLGLEQGIENKPKKEFYQYWNRDRNIVKHHNKNESETIEISDCDAAYWMIRRALANAKKLEIDVEMKQEFENWVIQHINL